MKHREGRKKTKKETKQKTVVREPTSSPLDGEEGTDKLFKK